MAFFKCKMCGGTIEFEQGASVGICDSCGTKQTLPKLDDEKRANLYDRANHFRRNNDFDKAMGIYEQILLDDRTDSEAYWSLVLCRYGIEYVKDPATHKRVPTVNRAQFTSIFADEDYKSALKYADGYQKEIYEQEAKAIDEIQKGILAISEQEEPFDIFICYKETDKDGRRTQDSVLANDLYHQLTQEGFKVFFSRITLEDKLGTAYEPYIFAALNSAKVMVCLGTKPEYFNAVWVKNEWSRYLSLVKQSDGKKMLIPAYRDMDPYELPEEFSHLQAQDMSKLGFMQDLIRGIKKIISSNAPNPAVIKETVISDLNTDTSPLLKRAFMFLEDRNWQEADEYCEKVLDRNPECAEAYLGKLMAEMHVQKQELLKNCEEPFEESGNYLKAVRFGSKELQTALSGYIEHIKERNENARMDEIYNKAVNAMKEANSEEEFKNIALKLKGIQGFKNSDELISLCFEKAEICRKDAIYDSAFWAIKTTADKKAGYEAAIEIFNSISGWKDAEEKINICRQKIEEIKAKEEAARLEAQRKEEEKRIAREKAAKKRKKIIAITTPIVCACIAFIIILNTVIIPNQRYARETKNLKTANVGDIINFGAYEQDNVKINGKEEIEWQVLDKKDNKLFLISTKALDCQQYNTSYTDVTWETCSLRFWLNDTFLNTAFSEKERSLIQTTTVSADKNPEYETNPGNETTDKVFLLSITEVEKYDIGKCIPTDYAVGNGAYGSSYRYCWWWLRSPGDNQDRAALINHDGEVCFYGFAVDYNHACVRPAMWINLDS